MRILTALAASVAIGGLAGCSTTDASSGDAEILKTRQVAVKRLERDIVKMARRHASDGIIQGPINGAMCNPSGGGQLTDVTSESTQFDCLAYAKLNSDGSAEGFNYSANMNWSNGRYSYKLSQS